MAALNIGALTLTQSTPLFQHCYLVAMWHVLGLSQSEACKLVSYLHMHPPTQLFKKTLLQRANLDRAIDFLDPATEDILGAPDLCWSLQHERGGSQVVIRSLLWPGYTFFHIPGTRHYGSLYDGTGIYNIDLPFMI